MASPKRKVETVRERLRSAGLEENPSDAILLLLAEVRALNARVAYLLGAMSVSVALLITLLTLVLRT